MLGIDEDADVQFYKGEGCQECSHLGNHGRRAVFEILTVDRALRRQITDDADTDKLKAVALDHGFVTMRDNCRELVLRGEISFAEATKAISSMT